MLATHLKGEKVLIFIYRYDILNMTRCVMRIIMYKKSHQEQFETKTGLTVHVRPLMAEDAPYLVDLFENMGSESRYNRFLQPADNISIDLVWTEAENIARQTIGENFGLVAFADTDERSEVPVAAARYVKHSSKQAEIAVSVRDDMQRIGIGSELLRLLIRRAEENGIDHLVGTIQNSNAAMWALMKKLDLRVEKQPEGSYSSVIIHVNESDSRREDWLDTAADYSPEPQIIW